MMIRIVFLLLFVSASVGLFESFWKAKEKVDKVKEVKENVEEAASWVIEPKDDKPDVKLAEDGPTQPPIRQCLSGNGMCTKALDCESVLDPSIVEMRGLNSTNKLRSSFGLSSFNLTEAQMTYLKAKRLQKKVKRVTKVVQFYLAFRKGGWAVAYKALQELGLEKLTDAAKATTVAGVQSIDLDKLQDAGMKEGIDIKKLLDAGVVTYTESTKLFTNLMWTSLRATGAALASIDPQKLAEAAIQSEREFTAAVKKANLKMLRDAGVHTIHAVSASVDRTALKKAVTDAVAEAKRENGANVKAAVQRVKTDVGTSVNGTQVKASGFRGMWEFLKGAVRSVNKTKLMDAPKEGVSVIRDALNATKIYEDRVAEIRELVGFMKKLNAAGISTEEQLRRMGKAGVTKDAVNKMTQMTLSELFGESDCDFGYVCCFVPPPPTMASRSAAMQRAVTAATGLPPTWAGVLVGAGATLLLCGLVLLVVVLVTRWRDSKAHSSQYAPMH